MNKVIVDEELKARLHNLDERVVLCDETGRTLGQFLPQPQFERMMYDWARAHFSDEELEQARQQPGGISTKQLLEHLNTL